MTIKTGEFRVIIVGGGIAGLAMANMLERLDIDYVLLEAYDEVAPQVGASIGLLPNSLRILDQLGCYDAIRALIQQPSDVAYARGSDGKPLMTITGLASHLIKRHGYPFVFVDRQMVLQVLYGHLKNKTKVLVKKRVDSITLISGGVRATLTDGSSYVGDILVGADGVHSFVRQEMWRIADELQPGWIPRSERTAMPCDYGCIFGISKPTTGIGLGTIHTVFKKHYSYLVIAGPGARVYWFLFVNIGRTYHPNFPRFTKKDEEELAYKHQDDPITEELKFGDIYKNRTSSVLTALPEYVFRRWYFGRIITIGDAAHKFEPISGQGGNNAIETAAALVNSLKRALESRPEGLQDADITSAFQQTQTLRAPRASQLVNESHLQQRIEAMENTFFKLLAYHLVPYLHLETQLRRFSDAAVPSVRLDELLVPQRPRFVPYSDELPNTPLNSKWFSVATIASLLLGLMWARAAELSLLSFNHSTRTELPLSLLFTVPTSRTVYFLAILPPVLLIWTVEGYRNGNTRTPISIPSLWILASQYHGFSVIAPLYYLMSVFTSANKSYERTSGRPIPAAVAKSLIPSLLCSYAVAITFALLDLAGPHSLYFPALISLIPSLIWSSSASNFTSLEMYEKKDVVALQRAYLFSFVIAATIYLSTFLDALLSTNFTTGALSSLAAWHEIDSKPPDNYFIIGHAAILSWIIYSIYELRRLGYVSTPHACKAACVVVLTLPLLGVGAVYVGTWSWREAIITRLVIIGGNYKEKTLSATNNL